VREDIVAGLKNAIERGYSLQLAKQSFLSAGYPADEVEAAVSYVKTGATGIIEHPLIHPQPAPQPPAAQPATAQPTPPSVQQPKQELSLIQQTAQPHPPAQHPAPIEHPPQHPPQAQHPPQQHAFTLPKPKKPFPWKIIILGGVLLILVVLLILTVVMRDKILGLFS